jgi:hypothetical protein
MLVALRPGTQHRLVQPESDIVIEGFPRSANTFAYHAFLYAQEETWDGHVGHHLHAASQLITAVKWDVPAVLLLRHPRDAVLSLLIRNPNLSARTALQGYVDYHEACLSIADDVVIGAFETVTSAFGEVIEAVNRRYDTSFTVFQHDTEAEEAVFERIEWVASNVDTAGSKGIARPTKKKDTLKRKRARELDQSKDLLPRAVQLFEALRSSID